MKKIEMVCDRWSIEKIVGLVCHSHPSIGQMLDKNGDNFVVKLFENCQDENGNLKEIELSYSSRGSNSRELLGN